MFKLPGTKKPREHWMIFRRENMLSENIKRLVQYGIDAGLTPECERIYTTNLLLELFHEDDYEETELHLSLIHI